MITCANFLAELEEMSIFDLVMFMDLPILSGDGHAEYGASIIRFCKVSADVVRSDDRVARRSGHLPGAPAQGVPPSQRMPPSQHMQAAPRAHRDIDAGTDAQALGMAVVQATATVMSCSAAGSEK